MSFKLSPQEARERAEQEAADRLEEKRAFKDYALEQEALREYEALAQLPAGRSRGPLHSVDDYAAFQGMAPSPEQLFR